MRFIETALRGAYVVELDKHQDHRGFFARTWCRNEFAVQGLSAVLAQVNVAYSARKGTLRGMHYQVPPHAEVKLVRCTRGAVWDAIIDLREESPTYTRWTSTLLTADNYRMFYVPERFAHGYLTLEDDTEVTYQVSEVYTPAAERGVRYDDPAFGILWPAAVTVMSDKDRAWPDYVPAAVRP